VKVAQTMFEQGNLRGALTEFRKLHEKAPMHEGVLIGIARCHAGLGRDDLAIGYLETAITGNAQVRTTEALLYGRILQRLGRYEEAIDVFLLAKSNEKLLENERIEANKAVFECRQAWSEQGTLSPIRMTHLGPEINSRFDEAAPIWVGNGQAIVFTSRRDGGKNADIFEGEGGDFKFFSDIYGASRSADGGWEVAEMLPGEINSMGHDAALACPGQGDSLFVYVVSDRTSGDIAVSTRTSDGMWQAPVPFSRTINSSYFEGSAAISGDGNVLYFISERPTGKGRGDVYVSRRTTGGVWEKPVLLDGAVNTAADEKFVATNADGSVLYFSSNGHPGYGDYDMYRTERVNGTWAIPVNLGGGINTAREESTFSVSPDGKSMLLAAVLPDGFGDRDIYLVDVADHPLLGDRVDQKLSGRLTVRVERAGSTLAGAQVELRDKWGSSVLASATANAQGVAEFRLYPDTAVQIHVTSKGQTATTDFRHDPPTPSADWQETVVLTLK
jgi:hypothetical protein